MNQKALQALDPNISPARKKSKVFTCRIVIASIPPLVETPP
jgi:hypothetical protein